MKTLTFAILTLIVSKSYASSIKQELTSPVTTSAAPYFWTGAAVTTTLLIFEDQVSDPSIKKTAHRKPLGDASTYGDLYGQVYPNAIYTLAMLGDSWLSERESSRSKAEHMFKSSVYAGLMATVIKYTAREPRPNNSKEKNSFPSGHTTMAFAFATVVATEHEWYWGTLALGMAGLTGYSRMNDNRHFLHDVAAGMTIGVSYGLGIHYTQKGQGKQFAFVPIIDEERTGLRLVAAW